ncbi:MAG TPA: methylmalonyl Co-A mutase-associated GTPase MeaB [Rhodothermales bacterium]|nr:methylmalonyl Co-A mutase-associated GTPase MeaB [Rhodothermales bacterium]
MRLPLPDVDTFCDGILSGNRMILSRALTLMESTSATHQELGQHVLERCVPYTGKSIRVGISGVPGVGKSTFIEAVGLYVASLGHHVAVLAIDPRSEKTRGSILGDKTRMEALSNHPRAFIRPTSSGGALGGVAPKTREVMLLCEAAGFDVVFVETVGVGQSETQVASMVDFFLLLMLAGAGDELQGIKRGIMELADGVVINKADGSNKVAAEAARVSYKRALHLFRENESGWSPKVKTCSALESTGIAEVWDMILAHHECVEKNGWLALKRTEQSAFWLHQIVENALKNHFYHHPAIRETFPEYEQAVKEGKTVPGVAANALLRRYREAP